MGCDGKLSQTSLGESNNPQNDTILLKDPLENIDGGQREGVNQFNTRTGATGPRSNKGPR